MKRFIACRAITMILFVLIFFLTTTAVFAEEPGNDGPLSPLGANFVEVTDAVSFLAAVGPNRTIHLLPGEYDLSADAVMEILQTDGSSEFPYVSYDSDLDYYSGIVISDVYNLIIIADTPQEIYTKNTDDTVLIFHECGFITVSGITLGHKPEKASGCTAGVFAAVNSINITLDGCDLYGCGYEGAGILLSSSILFEDCIIRDCTELAVYMEDVRNVRFVRTEFYGNGTECSYPSGLFWITGESMNITFQECNIHDNGNTYTKPYAMFRVDWIESELTVTDCEIENNLYDDYGECVE